MSGYILKEIEHDKVVMVKGEETLTLKVIDPGAKKDREAVSPPAAAPASPAPVPSTQVRPVPATQPQRPSAQPFVPDQAIKPRRTPYRPQ